MSSSGTAADGERKAVAIEKEGDVEKELEVENDIEKNTETTDTGTPKEPAPQQPRSPTKRGVEKWRGKRREERGSDGIGRLDA